MAPFSTRRTTTRQLSWNPAVGLETLSSSTLQITYAPSAIDFRIGGVSIYLDSLPSVSEYSALFDQYRIKGVTIRMDYNVNLYSNNGVAYASPLISYVMDKDDSNDLTLANMFQYPQVATHSFQENGYKPLILHFSPKPLVDIAGSGISTGYSPMKIAPFIRTTDLAIPHYGMKFAVQGNGGSVNAVIGFFQITTYVDLEFINPK